MPPKTQSAKTPAKKSPKKQAAPAATPSTSKPDGILSKALVADIIPYAMNARTHSPQQVAKIAASIKEFGFNNPILLWKDNVIIAGHGRWEAAQKLGLTEVPVVRLEHLTDEQRKQYILADNRIALDGGWDDEKLSLEMKGLAALGIDLGFTGFTEKELTALLADEPQAGLTDDDATPELKEKPIAPLESVWQLGEHRVMCGDSTDPAALTILMNKAKADMVFTDPPYGLDYSGGRTQVVAKKAHGKIQNDDLKGDDLGHLVSQIFEFNKPESDVYVCVSPIIQKPFLDYFESAGKEVNATIVWNKKQPGLGYMAYRRQCEFIIFIKGRAFKKGDNTDVDYWEESRDNGQKYVHGTQKPVALPERAINNSSKKGDLVLDLFGGSGSTLIACEKLGRIGHLMEIAPQYVDVIIKRWQDFTGKDAVLEGDGRTYNEYAAAHGEDAPEPRKTANKPVSRETKKGA